MNEYVITHIFSLALWRGSLMHISPVPLKRLGGNDVQKSSWDLLAKSNPHRENLQESLLERSSRQLQPVYWHSHASSVLMKNGDLEAYQTFLI